MPEMILPGTYIEVRAEGLIAPGPISIGNVGIVGTARRGRIGDAADPTTVYRPTNIGEAREFFGQYDAFTGTGRELTLVRALELAFRAGAQRVFAARVAGAAASATYTLATGGDPLTLTARAPGDGYNRFTITTGPAVGGNVDVRFELDALIETWRSVPAAVAEFAQVINGTHTTYAYNSLASTLSAGGRASNLFTVDTTGAAGDVTADQTATAGTTGENGESASATNYETGLNALLNQDVHIVVLAGEGVAAGARNMTTQLVGHVQNASTDLMKRERIGVIGSNPSARLTDLVAPSQDEGRLVFVGPGVRTTDSVSGQEVTLSGCYAAAAVAGLISSLDPHFSPTNKVVNVSGLETEFNGTELEQTVLTRVLALENKNGSIRVVRGITSSTNTAWAQVTTRRIVDFARFGVRAAADPFIGKLNNERVRQAMKASINTFLADMVDREMLISYDLDVSATRPQQIRGIAQVTMVLRPTFSIDYIRVVMYLE